MSACRYSAYAARRRRLGGVVFDRRSLGCRRLYRCLHSSPRALHLSTSDIRASFLSFFASHGHLIVPSSSLIPASDPSLLFTSAGMVPFKSSFLSLTPPPSPLVASSQRCLRSSGKHNDLSNVGYTARHHTFFEMLGNFSFPPSSSAADAVRLAYDFVTRHLHLPPLPPPRHRPRLRHLHPPPLGSGHRLVPLHL